MIEKVMAACERLNSQLDKIIKIAGCDKKEVAYAAVREIETFTAGVAAGVAASKTKSEKEEKKNDD